MVYVLTMVMFIDKIIQHKLALYLIKVETFDFVFNLYRLLKLHNLGREWKKDPRLLPLTDLYNQIIFLGSKSFDTFDIALNDLK